MLRLCPLATVVFIGFALGCGGDLREKSAKSDSVLAKETADAIRASQDLASFREAFESYERKRVQAGRPRRPREPLPDDIREAVADFHKRMTTDKKFPQVVMDTSMGKITIELYPSLAPVTVQNFLTYVDDKFFDGTIFHRVIRDFMIQGGGFTPDMQEKSVKPEIKNESGNLLANDRGTIAMARTNQPHSATAQFFINVVDNFGLDRLNADDGFGYAVFGKVVDGMDIVDKIRSVPTTSKRGHGDVPVEPVLLKSVRRVEAK